jgi:hypothetical protein
MQNLLVMEVKPANGEIKGMVDDLRKLTTFRRDLRDQWGEPGNYYAAYFWVYGLPAQDWQVFRARLIEASRVVHGIDRNLISCVIHERPAAPAVVVGWE